LATLPNETRTGRPLAYPNIPRATWWRLRKQFKTKMPKPLNEDYLVNTGVCKTKDSASNLVRPFKRIGLFDEDGNPTDRYFDWMDQEKYLEVCQQILDEVYPAEVRNIFTSTDEAEKERMEIWFQRRQKNLQLAGARQYVAFYMLLLEGDVTKQDEAVAQRPSSGKTVPFQRRSESRPRASAASARASAATAQESRPTSEASRPEQHDDTHHRTVRRGGHSDGPSLNINIQIHIPVEATADQIDQIFRSMSRHLYHREEEMAE
jgi:Family of unknown function (DUF5343)